MHITDIRLCDYEQWCPTTAFQANKAQPSGCYNIIEAMTSFFNLFSLFYALLYCLWLIDNRIRNDTEYCLLSSEYETVPNKCSVWIKIQVIESERLKDCRPEQL